MVSSRSRCDRKAAWYNSSRLHCSLILARWPRQLLKPFNPEDDIKGPYIERGNSNEWGKNTLLLI